MKATGYDCGNYVFDKDGYIVQISGDDIFFDCRNYKPIPLTEGWLLRCGFEKIEYINNRYELEPIQIYLNENYLKFRIVVYYKGMMIDGIIYVHQLQNLYFILTGKELEIK